MPSVLRIEPDDVMPNFYKLVHGYSKRFVEYVRLGIKPLTCRKYDAVNRQWSVHESRLSYVVSFGLKCFDQVDYGQLSSELQKYIIDTLNEWKNERPDFKISATVKRDPYFTLYVVSQAPWEVIKAAYTALVQLHHPDKGGKQEKFIEIQEAYEELKKKHKF